MSAREFEPGVFFGPPWAIARIKRLMCQKKVIRERLEALARDQRVDRDFGPGGRLLRSFRLMKKSSKASGHWREKSLGPPCRACRRAHRVIGRRLFPDFSQAGGDW